MLHSIIYINKVTIVSNIISHPISPTCDVSWLLWILRNQTASVFFHISNVQGQHNYCNCISDADPSYTHQRATVKVTAYRSTKDLKSNKPSSLPSELVTGELSSTNSNAFFRHQWIAVSRETSVLRTHQTRMSKNN